MVRLLRTPRKSEPEYREKNGWDDASIVNIGTHVPVNQNRDARSHSNKNAVRALWLCLLLTAACRHAANELPAASVHVLLPNDTTLAALGKVRIGMTRRELEQVRPGVEPAPYVGLREVVRGDTIRYIFLPPKGQVSDEPLMPIGAVPEENAQLMGVDLWHYVPAHEEHGIQRVVEFAQSPDAPAASCFVMSWASHRFGGNRCQTWSYDRETRIQPADVRVDVW